MEKLNSSLPDGAVEAANTALPEPIPEHPASGPVCGICGQVHPGGRFRVGCPGPRLQGGQHSRLLQDGALAPTEALVALAERQQEIERDQGGPDQLSRVHRDAIRDLLRLELVGDFLFDRLVRQGPLTGKGKTRAALSAYLGVADRLYRQRQLVGLSRRQKHVDPLEAVRLAVEEANRR